MRRPAGRSAADRAAGDRAAGERARPAPSQRRRSRARALALASALCGALTLATGASRAAAQGSPAGATCGASGVMPIQRVQGNGPRSPLLGRIVTVQGVVTASFPGRTGLGGLFLQEPGADGSGGASDGLFVALPSSPWPRPGEVLRVTGRVSEKRTLTQLTAVSGVTRCGRAPLPAARTVVLPLGAAGWEALEGMRVRVAGPLTVNDVHDLGRYGEMTLAAGRLFAPTQGVPGAGTRERGRIVLDDGSRILDPRPVPYLVPGGRLPRDGDTIIDGVEGVVSTVADDIHAIEPTRPVRLRASNPRPPRPASVGGSLRVATLNAHDFFTTLGDRGAGTPQTYALQRDKLVSALVGLDADVLVLEEIEANGMTSEDALLNALNARMRDRAYAAVPDPPAGVGRDRIKQAILYRPAALALLARASDPLQLFERAPVAATFRDGHTVLTVIAVHLKSKGGCPSAGDVDRGYGCWNLRRSAQARAVVDFAAARARAVGSPNVLIAGDLNSYAAEPPVGVFTAAGYRNAGIRVAAAERYSYVYRGAAGTLDYAFLSPSLATALTGASYWHIDADESPLLAAGAGLSPSRAAAAVGASAAGAGVVQAATPYRASDHDPLLVGLEPASARP